MSGFGNRSQSSAGKHSPNPFYWNSPVASERGYTVILAPVPHPRAPSILTHSPLGVLLHEESQCMCVANLIPERVWTQLCAHTRLGFCLCACLQKGLRKSKRIQVQVKSFFLLFSKGCSWMQSVT